VGKGVRDMKKEAENKKGELRKRIIFFS